MFRLIAVFILLLSSLSAQARWRPFQGGEIASQLAPMRFTNVSRCSLDAKDPTSLAYVMLDNNDLARGLQRLSLAVGHSRQERGEFVQKGILSFRTGLVELIQLIHFKMLNGYLPLLTANVLDTEKKISPVYKKIVMSCPTRGYCPQLEKYISKLWTSTSQNIATIDQFTKDHYVTKKDYRRKKEFKRLSCFKFSEFGPMQAHLQNRKPNKEALEEMARAFLQSDKQLSSCLDENLGYARAAFYHLELPPFLKKRKWKAFGFDYWHSMKLYLSWSYRHAPEAEAMFGPYKHVFKGVGLEDSILMMSGNCRSLAVPECSKRYLTQSSIRDFAQSPLTLSSETSNLLSEVPVSPDQKLLGEKLPSIYDDVLQFSSYPSVGEWLANFTENFSETRTKAKRDLLKSLSFLNLSVAGLEIKTLRQGLNKEFRTLIEDSLNEREPIETKRQDLFYLCSEFYAADDPNFGFLTDDLAILENKTVVDDLAKGISQYPIAKLFSYYKNVAKVIRSGCNRLRQKKIWDETFELEEEGFSSWYIEKFIKKPLTSQRKKFITENLQSAKPYMTYEKSGEVVCLRPSHCARLALESVISLRRAALYGDALLNASKDILSPNFANPTSEHLACGLYDPWFKTKSVLFDLLWDAGQAISVGGVNPLIFTRVKLLPKKPISFSELAEQGRLFYNPNYDDQAAITSLRLDFGPLLGVPCRISVSNSANVDDDAVFKGISVQACRSQEDFDLNVFTINDIDQQSSSSSGCLACQINFDSVSSSLAKQSGNISGRFFLLRGLVRLLAAFRDPELFPRSWSLKPKYLIETYRSFGRIPGHCRHKLLRGERCLTYDCDQGIAERIEKDYPQKMVTNIYPGKKSSVFYVSLNKCQKPAVVKVSRKYDDNRGEQTCRVYKYVSRPTCQGGQ